MKRKNPKIFDLKEWVDEYIEPSDDIVSEKNGITEYDEKLFILEQSRMDVINFMKKHATTFLELQALTLEYARTKEMIFPTIYTVVVKAAGEMNDRSYVNARMFWPMQGGKKKEFRFYICPYTEGMDIKSDKFMVMVKQKIARELRTRGEEGFFSSIDKSNETLIEEMFSFKSKPTKNKQ